MDIQAIPTWNISDQPVVGIDDGRSDENYFKSVAIDIPPFDGNQELKQGVIVFGPTQVAARSRAKSICDSMNKSMSGWHQLDSIPLNSPTFLAVIRKGEKRVVVGQKVIAGVNEESGDASFGFVFNAVDAIGSDEDNKVVGWLPFTSLPEIVDPEEIKEQLQKSAAWTW